MVIVYWCGRALVWWCIGVVVWCGDLVGSCHRGFEVLIVYLANQQVSQRYKQLSRPPSSKKRNRC